MKRLITLAVALVMAVCFTVTAQANLLEEYGGYKGTYTGQEVVFDSDGNRVTDPTQLLAPGLEMYALSIVDVFNTTVGAGSSATVNYPPIYNYDTGEGTYFATLTGLTTAAIVPLGEGMFDVYFTGGTLSWYYSETDIYLTLHGMGYDADVGDYVNGATILGDILPDPFLVANLALNDSEYTGKVTVTVEAGNVLRSDFTFYANVAEGYEFWQSGEYGNNNGGVGYDMAFGGNLVWQPNGKFYIDDGSFRLAAPTPEPSSIILMSLGLLLTAAFVRRQQSK